MVYERFYPRINRDYLIGLFAGIGLTKYWLLADGFLILTAIPFKSPPKAIWIISIIPLLTVFWSLDPVSAVFWFWRVHVIYSSFIKVKKKHQLAIGILIVVFPSILFASFETGYRPIGFTDNAQRLGLQSWALIPLLSLLPLYGSIGIGISAARLPLVLLIASAIYTRKRELIAGSIIALMVFFIHTPDGRLNPSFLFDAYDIRRELFHSHGDNNLKAIVQDRPDLIGHAEVNMNGSYKRNFEWFGYGYGSYSDYTGLSKPHNTFLLILYELGIFALPLFVVIGITIQKMQQKPLWLLGTTLVYMWFVDDFFGLPIGLYLLSIQWFSIQDDVEYI